MYSLAVLEAGSLLPVCQPGCAPPEGRGKILFLVDSSSRGLLEFRGSGLCLFNLFTYPHSVLSVLLKGHLLLDLEPTWIF